MHKHCAKPHENSIDIWGPIPAPMERKAGRYQAHMVLTVQRPCTDASFTFVSGGKMSRHNKPHGMKLSLDIDPQELS